MATHNMTDVITIRYQSYMCIPPLTDMKKSLDRSFSDILYEIG